MIVALPGLFSYLFLLVGFVRKDDSRLQLLCRILLADGGIENLPPRERKLMQCV